MRWYVSAMTRKQSLWALEKVALASEEGAPCPYISLMACTPSLRQRCHALRRRSLRVTQRLRGAALSTASASKGRGQGSSSLGWDMSAALALGDALGVPPLAMAELLPVIEAVMVAKLNEQMEVSHGRETR